LALMDLFHDDREMQDRLNALLVAFSRMVCDLLSPKPLLVSYICFTGPHEYEINVLRLIYCIRMWMTRRRSWRHSSVRWMS
jgi:hypothetical protein